jgi:hypothetical protein
VEWVGVVVAVAESDGKQGDYRAAQGKPPKATRFKKGQSGNPKGRPKGESLTTKLRRVLDEGDPKHGSKAEALIAVAVSAARRGDFRFFKEIIDRMDGKVPERIAGSDGEPLRIEVVYRQRGPAVEAGGRIAQDQPN